MDKSQLKELIRNNFDANFKDLQPKIVETAKKYSKDEKPTSAHFMRAYEEVTLAIVEDSLYSILTAVLEIDD